jgi:hypothetical protein
MEALARPAVDVVRRHPRAKPPHARAALGGSHRNGRDVSTHQAFQVFRVHQDRVSELLRRPRMPAEH